MRQNIVEVLVGALVLTVAALFFVYVYSTSGLNRDQSGYSLRAVFQNIEGIRIGSDVRLGGVKVGSVVGQSLDPKSYDITLTLSVAQSLKLPEDTTAKITADGIMGAKFIALEPGGSEKILGDGGVLTYTQGAVDVWSLVSGFLFKGKEKEGQAGAPAFDSGAKP